MRCPACPLLPVPGSAYVIAVSVRSPCERCAQPLHSQCLELCDVCAASFCTGCATIAFPDSEDPTCEACIDQRDAVIPDPRKPPRLATPPAPRRRSTRRRISNAVRSGSGLRRIPKHLFPHSYLRLFAQPRIQPKSGPGGVQLIPVSKSPNIFLIPDFITQAECDWLVNQALAKHEFQGSFTNDAHNNRVQDPNRTSTFRYLPRQSSSVIRSVEARAAGITGMSILHVEPLQIVSYGSRQKFELHHDAGTLEVDAHYYRARQTAERRLRQELRESPEPQEEAGDDEKRGDDAPAELNAQQRLEVERMAMGSVIPTQPWQGRAGQRLLARGSTVTTLPPVRLYTIFVYLNDPSAEIGIRDGKREGKNPEKRKRRKHSGEEEDLLSSEDLEQDSVVEASDQQHSGHTQFPCLGLSVKPRPRSALLWGNLDPHSGVSDWRLCHRAVRVEEGQWKLGMNIWVCMMPCA